MKKPTPILEIKLSVSSGLSHEKWLVFLRDPDQHLDLVDPGIF